MTITPDKSALAQARERLEAATEWRIVNPITTRLIECTVVAADIWLVLDALEEAEKRLEQFEECQLDSDGFCTDENCNRHD